MLQSESSLDEQQPGMGPGLWQQGSKAGIGLKVKRKQRHKIEIYLNLALQVLSVLNECFRNDSKWDKVQHE